MLPPHPTASSASPTLNPQAESWTQSSDAEITQIPPPPLYQPNKMANFYIASPTSPPVLPLSPATSVTVLHHQPLFPLTPPIPRSSVLHYHQVVFTNGHPSLCSVDPGSFNLVPQAYPHQRTVVILPPNTSAPHPVMLPLLSSSSGDFMEMPYDEEKVAEKKPFPRIWRRRKVFVPPRLQKNHHQNMERFQGRSKNVILQKQWMPKKKTDHQLAEDGDYGVSIDSADYGSPLIFSPPPPNFPTRSSSSSMVNFRSCKKTTVMIRNIPNKYKRNSLMQFLDVYCQNHNLAYDFFYLPMDFRRHDNLGYAFVNFTTPKAAIKIMDLLEGFVWYGNKIFDMTILSNKICEVSWAAIQGKKALVKHFSNSKFVCDNREYLPVVFHPPRNGSAINSRLPITVGKIMKQKGDNIIFIN
ncbi:OLC1v1015422C1 [Oldenlandia corymbosa var. corymbosa]|uniref:OLC1v1015422C1 n=1 Tax=Oldenlandia corymbosa var. corymbosa TaxID=529605 RepID=A0AAV1E331_OLDCO|nr:OLC1v1015422C1 [Oldenlandia corymbosa var. corymbosa]